MKLGLCEVVSMSDSEVEAVFRAARWGDTVVCPRCDSKQLYVCQGGKSWKCKACRHAFTVTSGTMFASRKLPLRVLLVGVVLFVSGSKGIPSIQLGKMLGCQYKTAFVFAHKIRDALMQEQAELPALEGHVEIDGAFFGGHIERFNFVDKRTGKVHVRRRHGERRVVVVARQRAGRTLTKVVKKESDALPFVRDRVSTGANIHADLGHAWDGLNRLYSMMRVGHHVGFSIQGACTNQAESFFAMMRRKQMGVHHRMSGANLGLYAAEMAWRTDFNRMAEGHLPFLLLQYMMGHTPSLRFKGYWQRRAVSA